MLTHLRSFASTSTGLTVVEVVVVEGDDTEALLVVEVELVVVREPGRVGSTNPSSGTDVDDDEPTIAVSSSLSSSLRKATTNPATSSVQASTVAAMNCRRRCGWVSMRQKVAPKRRFDDSARLF